MVARRLALVLAPVALAVPLASCHETEDQACHLTVLGCTGWMAHIFTPDVRAVHAPYVPDPSNPQYGTFINPPWTP